MSFTIISAQEFARRLQSGTGIELIDVRTPVEFREVHVNCARNVPLDTLKPEQLMQSRAGNNDAPLYVVCKGGNRSNMACQKFVDCGYEKVISIEGGTTACEAAGVPVVRGKKAISLERQVRIAAGSLVLVGAVLGYSVNPLFIGLSAFVGAGLVFAGITDTCGMGMLLSKMPWNQCATECCSTENCSPC